MILNHLLKNTQYKKELEYYIKLQYINILFNLKTLCSNLDPFLLSQQVYLSKI